MSALLIVILVLYGLVAATNFSVYADQATAPRAPEVVRRQASRLALASPFWPLLLLWAIGTRLRWLWRAADFGRSS